MIMNEIRGGAPATRANSPTMHQVDCGSITVDGDGDGGGNGVDDPSDDGIGTTTIVVGAAALLALLFLLTQMD